MFLAVMHQNYIGTVSMPWLPAVLLAAAWKYPSLPLMYANAHSNLKGSYV